MSSITISTHDYLPPEETKLIDRGLEDANLAVAPLQGVQPISCFARTEFGAAMGGTVIGGAVGRRWEAYCELQQLWVEQEHRRQGIGTQLLRAFEAQAQTHGCESIFLETFSFQTPSIYESLGFEISHEIKLYPHNIVKYIMVKWFNRTLI